MISTLAAVCLLISSPLAVTDLKAHRLRRALLGTELRITIAVGVALCAGILFALEDLKPQLQPTAPDGARPLLVIRPTSRP